jgi:ABC-2 type transport system ATP-binding protein
MPTTTNTNPAASADPLIDVRGLSKHYGGFTAIENVTFSVARGSIAAFLGPNGAGKSTTMKILTGFLAPSAGVAKIGGYDMSRDRIPGSRLMGYLGENGPLYPDMTPAAYLRYVGQVRGITGSSLKQSLERVADACQLREVWSKPVRKLSKGFRQRVGLAQAMIHDPQVLILDEPTAGLDPNQIRVVRDLIRNFAKGRRTVLLSTHILQEVEAMADHVLLISEGRLKFDGTPADLAGQRGLEARFRELTKGVAA